MSRLWRPERPPYPNHCAGCRTTRDGWLGAVCPECAKTLDRLSLGLIELTAYVPRGPKRDPLAGVGRVFEDLFGPSLDPLSGSA